MYFSPYVVGTDYPTTNEPLSENMPFAKTAIVDEDIHFRGHDRMSHHLSDLDTVDYYSQNQYSPDTIKDTNSSFQVTIEAPEQP